MEKKGSVLFLLLLILFLSISCSRAPEKDQNSGTPDPTAKTGLDLDGRTVQIAMESDSDTNLFKYSFGTLLADAAQAHLDRISDECNGTMSVYGRSYDELMMDITVGKDSADILYLNSIPHLYNLVLAEGLVDMKDYRDVVDFEHDEKKYGPVNARELGMVKGGQYALTPFSWPEMRAASCGLIAVNEGLVSRFGLEDPRELVEKKSWYWSDFEEYIDRATFQDDIKYYGMGVSWYPDVPPMAFLSNGCAMFSLQSDGTYVSEVDSEAGLEAIQWSIDLRIDHKSSFYKGTVSRNNPSFDGFLNGEVFLHSTSTTTYTDTIAYAVKDTGILPFPVGPRGTYGKWVGTPFEAYQFSVFFTADDPGQCLQVIDCICEPLKDYPDRESLCEYYVTNTFYDSRDADLYLQLTETATYDSMYGACSFNAFWNIFAEKNDSAVELVASTFDSYIPIAEEYIIPNMIYISEIK